MNLQEVISSRVDMRLASLALDANNFYVHGVAPDDSQLRVVLRMADLPNNAVNLLLASHIIFRECYLRGISASSLARCSPIPVED